MLRNIRDVIGNNIDLRSDAQLRICEKSIEYRDELAVEAVQIARVRDSKNISVVAQDVEDAHKAIYEKRNRTKKTKQVINSFGWAILGWCVPAFLTEITSSGTNRLLLIVSFGLGVIAAVLVGWSFD